MKSILISLIFSLTAVSAIAQTEGPDEKVAVSVSKAYIPQGFDNNDVTRIVVEGVFPNTCYKLGKNSVKVNPDTNTIEVTQMAYVYKEMCLMMLVPFNQSVEVGVIKNTGSYKVQDAKSTKDLGQLPVAESRNSGPDDNTYANIDEAYVTLIEPNRRVVVLRGTLPDKCWTLTEKKIMLEGTDVLTVLPIMDYTPSDICDGRAIPFSTTVDIPTLKNGRYMLNVRSLSGSSITRLFDVSVK